MVYVLRTYFCKLTTANICNLTCSIPVLSVFLYFGSGFRTDGEPSYLHLHGRPLAVEFCVDAVGNLFPYVVFPLVGYPSLKIFSQYMYTHQNIFRYLYDVIQYDTAHDDFWHHTCGMVQGW